jgi:hypothetical protein
MNNIMTSTIRWKWIDQDGLEHAFDMPDSLYVPEEKCCLLGQKATGWRAWETTDAETCSMLWLGGEKRLVIPIGVSANVATILLAPGYDKFMPRLKSKTTMSLTPLSRSQQWQPAVTMRERRAVRGRRRLVIARAREGERERRTG